MVVLMLRKLILCRENGCNWLRLEILKLIMISTDHLGKKSIFYKESSHQIVGGNITPSSTSECTSPRRSRIAGSDTLKTVTQTNKGAVDNGVDLSSSNCVMPRKHVTDDRKERHKRTNLQGMRHLKHFISKILRRDLLTKQIVNLMLCPHLPRMKR